MNVVEARLERSNGTLTAIAGNQRMKLTEETLAARPGLAQFEERNVILGIRPEDLEDAALARDIPEDQRITGRVELTEALGAEIMVHFTVDAPPAMTDEMRELARDVGDEEMRLAQAESGGAVMVGRFGARSRVKPGDDISIAVDTRALHFFDPDTGLGIYGQQDTTKGAA